MIGNLKNRVRRGGIAAAAVLLVAAVVPVVSLQWLGDAHAERDRVQAQVHWLHRVESLLVDAETGQRGFVITGKEEFLKPYLDATIEIPGALAELRDRFADEPDAERRTIAELEDDAHRKLSELAQTVALRREGGFAAVEPVVTAGTGAHFMDEVRKLSSGLVAGENAQLAQLERDVSRKLHWALALSALSTLFSIGVFLFLGRNLWDAIVHRERLSEQAGLANERLEHGMRALQARNDEVSTLGEMARVLQTEMSLREALEVTALFCGRLLPGTRGVVFLYRNSADILERAAVWGTAEADAAPTLEPKSCWGLRLGHLHRCDSRNALHCGHYTADGEDVWRVCIPLMAYGEVLGLLELAADGPRDDRDALSATAQTIAEQVALSLSNAKLRQVLRDQSIRDPLTGLFNRRYMEETLVRELTRAQRHDTPLSVVVVDLDHFKKINDTHGHPAGDAVLRRAGQHLGGSLRGSDLACRYGGEEFVLILPECSKEAALAKATELCERTRTLTFPDGGAGVQVTASFGVASFPVDANEWQGLIQAADAALYSAKRSGRDRVVAAGWSAAVEARLAAAEA